MGCGLVGWSIGHRTAALEPGELRRVEAGQPDEHLGVVLAQQGSGAAQAPRRDAKLVGRAGQTQAADDRVLALDDDAGGTDLGTFYISGATPTTTCTATLAAPVTGYRLTGSTCTGSAR